MKTNITRLSLVALLATSLFALNNVEAKDLGVISSESSITWIGKKGIQVLGEHSGNVAIKEGSVELNDKNEIKKAMLTVDMTKITNKDLTGDWQKKLLTHLESKDFFDIKEYPTAHFESKSVKKLGNNIYKLKGNLVVKGIKKAAEITGSYKQEGNKHRFSGNFSFDRTDYKMTFNSGNLFANLGDKLVHDMVSLSFDISAK